MTLWCSLLASSFLRNYSCYSRLHFKRTPGLSFWHPVIIAVSCASWKVRKKGKQVRQRGAEKYRKINLFSLSRLSDKKKSGSAFRWQAWFLLSVRIILCFGIGHLSPGSAHHHRGQKTPLTHSSQLLLFPASTITNPILIFSQNWIFCVCASVEHLFHPLLYM